MLGQTSQTHHFAVARIGLFHLSLSTRLISPWPSDDGRHPIKTQYSLGSSVGTLVLRRSGRSHSLRPASPSSHLGVHLPSRSASSMASMHHTHGLSDQLAHGEPRRDDIVCSLPIIVYEDIDGPVRRSSVDWTQQWISITYGSSRIIG